MRNQITKVATPMDVGLRAVTVVAIALAFGGCGDDRAPTEIRVLAPTISEPPLADAGRSVATPQRSPRPLPEVSFSGIGRSKRS